MNRAWRSALQGVVIVAGAVVIVASLAEFRFADWPIYVVFLLLCGAVFLPSVEVLPRLTLAIPEMAATIGFLYIAGLPIVVLRFFAPILTWSLRWVLPTRWKQRIVRMREEAGVVRREPFAISWRAGTRVPAGTVAEWATFTLGLGTRWWVATMFVPQGPPVTDAGAIALAEFAGYTCWGLLSIVPIYPDGTLLPLSSGGRLRSALTDIGLIVVLALTPFVFLITYGFETEGLAGASAWALSTLGLHFMLKRLNERRLTVEEQNRRLEALNRQLEHRERLSAIGKMSSVVSHQILQQLGVIGIYADLIRHADQQGEPAAALGQARDNAVAIEGALRDVNRVLTDLLVFSKDLRLNLYEHDIDRVIAESIEDCRAEAAERRVTLRAECPAGIGVTLDKLKMKQALVNVLRNAVEVSPPGSEVVVRAAMHDGCVEVAVSDRGPGVPARDREAVFTPFFTTKEHGTGLGLAIAREFTEAHGGHLRVDGTTAGPGATFTFRLPLRRDEVSPEFRVLSPE